MNGSWVAPDLRDEVVDFVTHWSARTELPVRTLVAWLGLARGKFYDWRKRYGQLNEHNGKIPRDFWLEEHEKQAIVDSHDRYPLEGYRRLCFMMIDDDVVAVSPSSVYRVLKEAGRLDRWPKKTKTKGTGFQQPLAPHDHWHMDVSYVNLEGTFYYLTSVLDGCSRFLVHSEIRESMQEVDIEIVLERAREKYPEAHPRIISDNGSAFIAKDFKTFIRIAGMSHVRTSPSYPQSNGKIERFHRTAKTEVFRRFAPSTQAEAKARLDAFLAHYNGKRLHSAIGYITPGDRLAGRQQAIWDGRDRKLELARKKRRLRRRLAITAESVTETPNLSRSR